MRLSVLCNISIPPTLSPLFLVSAILLSFTLLSQATVVVVVDAAAFLAEQPQQRRGRRIGGGLSKQQHHDDDDDDNARRDYTSNSRRRNKHLVIVGGGIGGLSCAYDARHLLKNDNVHVTVVSNQENFSFTPSNPWIAIRKRQARDIQLPLDTILPRHGIEFIHAAVTKVEPNKNRLTLEHTCSADGGKKDKKKKKCLDYDYLIIATGPRLAFEEIPGLSPPITTTTTTARTTATTTTKHTSISSAASSICTTPHALHTANLVDALQKDPGPIVVGATQGASCFGPAYEFILLLHHELHQRGGPALVDACRPMTFVTSEPFVGHLGLNGAGDSRKIMETLLAKHGIEYMTSTRTVRASPTSLTVERLDEATGKVLERKVLSNRKLIMMIPPFHGLDVWKRVPNLTDDKGLVLVNEYQQNPTYHNIFAVGVAVSMPNTVPTRLHCGIPKTGYLIESQGTAAIRNIQTLLQAADNKNNESRDDNDNDDDINQHHDHVQLHSRPLLNALCITDFGNDGAVFVTLPQSPPRRLDVTIHGKVATLAKIAFEKYFLHKIETGDTDPYYEHYMLKLVGIERTLED